MTWKDGVLTRGSVKSITGTSGIVRYGEKTLNINLKKGETVYLNTDLKTIKKI